MMLFAAKNRYSESAFDADLFNTSPDEFEEYFLNYQNMPTKMSAWGHETWDTYKSKVALKDRTILKPQSKDDLSYSHEISKFEIFREDSPLKYVDFKIPERKLPQSSPRTEVANECFIDQNRLRHPPVGPASDSFSNSSKYVKDNFLIYYSDSKFDAICDSDVDFNFSNVTKDLDKNDNSDIVYSTPNDQVLDLRQKFNTDDFFY